MYASFSALYAADTMEHSLDHGDGPPGLQVKSCTPEFYQTHYQLVSLAKWQEEKHWEMRYPSWASDLSLCIHFFPAFISQKIIAD